MLYDQPKRLTDMTRDVGDILMRYTSLGRAQGNVEIEPHARMLLVKGQHRDCRSSLDEPPCPKGPGASALKLIVITPQAPEMFLSL